jgi:excisionase family DNA binding protein
MLVEEVADGGFGPPISRLFCCPVKGAELNDEHDLVTEPELARLLRVSIRTLKRLRQHRVIPFLKIGGTVRYSRQKLMKELSVEKSGDGSGNRVMENRAASADRASDKPRVGIQ